MRGWTAAAGTGESGTYQDASECGPADVNTLPLSEQLTEVGVVGASVPGAGQVHNLGDHATRRDIGGSSTPVAVGERGRSLLPVGRQ